MPDPAYDWTVDKAIRFSPLTLPHYRLFTCPFATRRAPPLVYRPISTSFAQKCTSRVFFGRCHFNKPNLETKSPLPMPLFFPIKTTLTGQQAPKGAKSGYSDPQIIFDIGKFDNKISRWLDLIHSSVRGRRFQREAHEVCAACSTGHSQCDLFRGSGRNGECHHHHSRLRPFFVSSDATDSMSC